MSIDSATASASEDSNASSLFRSFSASDQLRQVVECSNVKLRVHRDTVVFSGLRQKRKQHCGTLEILREDGNDWATKCRGFANFTQDPIVALPGFEAPIRADEDKCTTGVNGCPYLRPELTRVRFGDVYESSHTPRTQLGIYEVRQLIARFATVADEYQSGHAMGWLSR